MEKLFGVNRANWHITRKLNLGNRYMKELPPEIGEFKNVEYLDLWNNRLQSLPPEIGRLKRLIKLDLSTNRFTESPMDILSELTSLKEIVITSNNLSESSKELLRFWAEGANVKIIDEKYDYRNSHSYKWGWP